MDSVKVFQHTAARRRLPKSVGRCALTMWFQHTAARRRLLPGMPVRARATPFQHTAARRRLPWQPESDGKRQLFQHTAARRRLRAGRQHKPMGTRCFNTQPPEGGCRACPDSQNGRCRFNTQPPEGGCMGALISGSLQPLFQHTAARRRLPNRSGSAPAAWRFQHTAARRRLRR